MSTTGALPPLEERTMAAAMERAVRRWPDAPAQADRDQRLTFAQVRHRALTVGGGIRDLGVPRAGSIAFMLDNHLDLVHLWFGAALTGVVQVPVNTAYKGQFLAHVLNDSAAEVVVVDAAYWPRLEAVADDIPAVRTVVVRGELPTSGPRGWTLLSFDMLLSAHAVDPVPVGAADVMSCMYTSGTTGLSKGALLSHAHTYTYASREDQERRPGPDDRMLVTLPLFHLGAQGYGVMQSLIHGAFCYIAPRFSVSGFWPLVHEERLTATLMLGTVAELLLQSDPHPDEVDNPMKFAYMAPLPSNVEAFVARFAMDAIPVYGSTEMGCVMTGAGDRPRAGEVGSARGNYDLRLVDESGADVAPGESGELLVRPHVPHTIFEGYRNMPDKTAETIRDGWIHTGDVLRLDDDGHYYFSDRIKDSMRRKGENISSFEVESAINAHPAVFESAVLAVPSELSEDEVLAAVVLRDDLTVTPAELVDFLDERLPAFMVPRFVTFLDQLPKTVTMKLDKVALRAAATGEVWDRERASVSLIRPL